MKKLIIGVFAAASLFGGAATFAEAKTNFQIYFGTPYYDQQIDDDYRFYPNRGWYRYNRPGIGLSIGNRISCDRARRLVRNQGYRNIVARDCDGRTYTFSARRNNRQVTIYVNSRTGSVRRG